MKKILCVILVLLFNYSYAYSNDFFDIQIPESYKISDVQKENTWEWGNGVNTISIRVESFDKKNTVNVNQISLINRETLFNELTENNKKMVEKSYFENVNNKDYFVIKQEYKKSYVLFGEKFFYIVTSSDGNILEILRTFIIKDNVPGNTQKKLAEDTIIGSLGGLIILILVAISVNNKTKGINIFHYYKMMWKNIFNVKGRAGRKSFWAAFLINSIISLSLILIAQLPLLFTSTSILSDTLSGIGSLLIIASLIPGITIMVRRLHDIGVPGWIEFIILFPGIGYFILLMLAIIKGKNEDNKYGESEDW